MDVVTPEHEPAWQIARLFPVQGEWTEESYLSFTESLSQCCELVDGRVEVPEMPTKTHQQLAEAVEREIAGNHRRPRKPAANCRGVRPACRWKWRVKLLWSQKPRPRAIAAIVPSPRRSFSHAERIRHFIQ